MNMEVIIPLLVGDMRERLITESRLGTFDDTVVAQGHSDHAEQEMIEQINKCKTMSNINQLLCNYHFLFSDGGVLGVDGGRSVVSVDGTQEYVIRLLTERIETDADIIYDALKYG